jgi:hypothetical protein
MRLVFVGDMGVRIILFLPYLFPPLSFSFLSRGREKGRRKMRYLGEGKGHGRRGGKGKHSERDPAGQYI